MVRVERLGPQHVRRSFTCGKPQLDDYIVRMAGQDIRRGVARVFVLVDDGAGEVVGYYTLSAHNILLTDLPADLQSRLPRYPSVPATLLGRLAVSVGRRGQQLGKFLLMDALRRAVVAARDVASVAVVVDALDEDAVTFYERYGFHAFAGHPLKLYLPIATLRALPGWG